MFKTFIAGVGAAGIAASTIVSFAPSAVAQEGCTPVHIISVPGANGTHSNAGNDVTNALEGAITKRVQDARPDAVSSWQPAYPAAAGAAWSAVSLHGEGNTFGRSRLIADKEILDHLKSYIANCSDSKVAVVGFSEGAAVAGDVLALLANGAVEGLDDDNILGGIAFAEPGRSGKSQFSGPAEDSTAYIEHPTGLEYQRNGEYATATAENSIGWVGQRSLDYGKVGQRFISVCNDADMACSVPVGSPLRAIADISDKDINGNPAYESSTSLVNVFESGALFPLALDSVGDGFIGKILGGDVSGALDALEKNARTTDTMNQNERGMVLNFIREARELIEILKKDNAYGSSTSERQIMGHLIKEVYPAFSGTLPPEVKQVTDPIVAGYANAEPIPADVAERVNPLVAKVKDFNVAHGAYFADSGFTVDGKRADAWAGDALIAAVDRAVAGETVTIPAGDSPRSEAETAEEDRRDDGLRALLETGELPPLGTLDDSTIDNPTTNPTSNPSNTSTTGPVSDSDSDSDGSGSNDSDSDSDSDGSDSSTSTTSTTTPTAPRSTSATPVGKSYGPTVDTGGTVKDSWLDRLVSVIR